MQLTDEQKKEVTNWIQSGAKLSEVQQRLAEEFGIRMTYMEARFLVDDLKLVPQEKVEEKPAEAPKLDDEEALEEAPLGGVHMSIDEIVRPGALISGKVTFSDGVQAEWSLDRAGRFGLLPEKEGYRPSQDDLAEFQRALQTALAKKGY